LNLRQLWSELLFESRDASEAGGWDGTYKDQTLAEGVYLYMIEHSYNAQGLLKKDYVEGVLHVLR